MNQQQKQFKVILIGDDCQDYYEYVTIDRISPEAPVPVCVTQHIEEKPGMAANVGQNLKNLGCNVSEYLGELSTKKRIIDLNSKQHLLRIDNDVKSKPFNFDLLSTDCDAIVISDYNKGFLDDDAITTIIKFSNQNKIPIFIDTKKQNLSNFNGSFVKINQLEYNNRLSDSDNMIVTQGSKGVMFKDKIFDVPKINVTDVCGAGDTFLAALVVKYLETKNMETAIEFAIKASSVTVQHIGVYAPTLKEIECV
jgi:D-beta-D-heptose 7-phosphate kinase/D-beta-D-heptose 1-phosphate adenosyltransferase